MTPTIRTMRHAGCDRRRNTPGRSVGCETQLAMTTFQASNGVELRRTLLAIIVAECVTLAGLLVVLGIAWGCAP